MNVYNIKISKFFSSTSGVKGNFFNIKINIFFPQFSTPVLSLNLLSSCIHSLCPYLPNCLFSVSLQFVLNLLFRL